jgi:hypothetical protein
MRNVTIRTCWIWLACIIHESKRFVNNHPQQNKNVCCGFRHGALPPLKASPERRPERPESKPFRRIVHEVNRNS